MPFACLIHRKGELEFEWVFMHRTMLCTPEVMDDTARGPNDAIIALLDALPVCLVHEWAAHPQPAMKAERSA